MGHTERSLLLSTWKHLHMTVKLDRSRSRPRLIWTEAVSGLYDGLTSAVWILNPTRFCSVSCIITDINRPEVSFSPSHQHDDSRQSGRELVQRQSWRGISLIDEYQLDQTWHNTERLDLLINTCRWSDPDSADDEMIRTTEPFKTFEAVTSIIMLLRCRTK